MKKFFDIKALKSSEECDKFSKSVSYETLVVGTATTDTDIKQTQWLSKGSANKPLTAVGTFTAFSNALKVLEKRLQNVTHFKVGFVTKRTSKFLAVSVLAAVLTVCSTEEVKAATCVFSNGGETVTITGEGGETITSKVCNSDNSSSIDSGWTFNQDWKTTITTANIGSGIESIASNTFYGAVGLSSVMISEGVESIGYQAFANCEKLSLIKIPSSVSSIGNCAFRDVPMNTELIISEKLSAENVAGWDANAFLGHYDRINKITCTKTDGSSGGDERTCAAAMARFLSNEDNGECYAGIVCLNNVQKIGNICVGKYFGSVSGNGSCVNKSTCINGGNLLNSDTRQCVQPASCTGMYVADMANKKCIKMPGCVDYANGACGGCERGYYKKDGGCVSATDGCGDGYLEKDSICISASQGCGEGYKDMGGFCNRIRYTPAEAAPLLHNDNTNEVTITFRK